MSLGGKSDDMMWLSDIGAKIDMGPVAYPW